MSKTLSITEGYDPNYLAVVVTIPDIKPHSNADKLECVEIFGNNIIIGKNTYTKGELVVFFPVECCISIPFLSWANLLEKPELNADEKTKGYFDCKRGRVRAVSLRGMPSQGFLFKVSELAKYYDVDEKLFKVGDCFDCIGTDTVVTKWTKETKGQPSVKKSRFPKWVDNAIRVFPRPVRIHAYKFVNAWYNRKTEGILNRIVDGQFAFHYSTPQLGPNLFLLKPDDNITISAKCHGTSQIVSNLLVKKPFNPITSLGVFLGFNVTNIEYKFIYASRSIVKNRKDGKYTDDVYGLHASKLEGIIPKGYSVYGELVGSMPSGKNIQKGYDYGVPECQSEFWVYRVVHIHLDGTKYELTFEEIQKFCSALNLKTVPKYYSGKASELFDIPVDENWNNNFLSALKEKYLDKTCEFCTTGVVNEGIVLKIDSRDARPVFKFKSPKFLQHETQERDNGETNLEEEN